MAWIGSLLSMWSATASVLPSAKRCRSSARTRPHSYRLLMMKPMRSPLEACAVMAQSENLPRESKLAATCHTPEMKAALTAPESDSPAASKVAESAALLAFAVMMGPVGRFPALKHRNRQPADQPGKALTAGSSNGDQRVAVAPPVDFSKRRGPGDGVVAAFLENCNCAGRHPSAF